MKKIFLLILVAAFVSSSCKKESLNVSKITTYAVMTLNGAPTLFWSLNTPFVDPGCVALQGTTDLTSKIVVASNIDVTKGGKYAVTYKVQNSDGFYASTSRIVYVIDKTAPLNGYYTSNVKRDNAGVFANRGPFIMMMYGVGNGNY